jgi:hypothetical protein
MDFSTGSKTRWFFLVREEGVEPPQPFGHRVTAGYPLHVVSVPGWWGAYGMYLSCPSSSKRVRAPSAIKGLTLLEYMGSVKLPTYS